MGEQGPGQPFGIYELYSPGQDATVDIVAVHGLNGDAFRTWTTETHNICWLNHPDFLPKYLPTARILTWGYNANVTSLKGKTTSQDRIQQHAHTLVAQLHADRYALYYSKSRDASKIQHLHLIYTCTYGIVFFGTPHNGAPKAHLLASLEKLVATAVPKKTLETDKGLLQALKRDSEVLDEVTDNFAPLMRRFHMYFFWEQERTDLKYTKAYIVDQTSAAPIFDNTERSGIAADHREMCRFGTKDAAGFRTVAAALKRYEREAPTVIEARIVKTSEAFSPGSRNEANELIKSAYHQPNNARLLEPASVSAYPICDTSLDHNYHGFCHE